MAKWDVFTPGLYNISKRIAKPIITNKWDEVVVPILHSEDKFYLYTFSAFYITNLKHANSSFGFSIFTAFLTDDGIDNYEALLLEKVFEVYWDLAENDAYWVGGQVGYDRQLPFDDAVQQWSIANQPAVQRWEERLLEWVAEK